MGTCSCYAPKAEDPFLHHNSHTALKAPPKGRYTRDLPPYDMNSRGVHEFDDKLRNNTNYDSVSTNSTTSSYSPGYTPPKLYYGLQSPLERYEIYDDPNAQADLWYPSLEEEIAYAYYTDPPPTPLNPHILVHSRVWDGELSFDGLSNHNREFLSRALSTGNPDPSKQSALINRRQTYTSHRSYPPVKQSQYIIGSGLHFPCYIQHMIPEQNIQIYQDPSNDSNSSLDRMSSSYSMSFNHELPNPMAIQNASHHVHWDNKPPQMFLFNPPSWSPTKPNANEQSFGAPNLLKQEHQELYPNTPFSSAYVTPMASPPPSPRESINSARILRAYSDIPSSISEVQLTSRELKDTPRYLPLSGRHSRPTSARGNDTHYLSSPLPSGRLMRTDSNMLTSKYNQGRPEDSDTSVVDMCSLDFHKVNHLPCLIRVQA
eukprot:NODE_2896_length_1465_cov_54.394188_g2506_i0.p1 GENE.NODE_2896_length_1465_cov_54.394188_g2506_i0~~NODE_2896_length_1465_cov_54.394188_g2506_i0.p1  ORF type:complete len:430 (-),score=69.55 NODE_2896_length_1465_cov_54.394188_g2506_i0:99-1388(-)